MDYYEFIIFCYSIILLEILKPFCKNTMSLFLIIEVLKFKSFIYQIISLFLQPICWKMLKNKY